jgi:hypothetical protein
MTRSSQTLGLRPRNEIGGAAKALAELKLVMVVNVVLLAVNRVRFDRPRRNDRTR